MAKKTKAQIEAESRAKEVADTVADTARQLVLDNYAHIVASASESGYQGAKVGIGFTVTTDALVRKMTISIPRKATRAEIYPESPADKAQEKFGFATKGADNDE